MPAGRKTAYKSEYEEQAKKLCMLGATDVTLADFFEVKVSTINNWKKKHPAFLESLKKGKLTADAEVASKLFDRATGFEWDEQQAIKVKEVNYKDGKRLRESEHVEMVTVHRVVPPDTTAIIFWLKNRQKADWRDKQDHEVTGKDGEAIAQAVNVTYMPEPLPDDYFKHRADNNGK